MNARVLVVTLLLGGCAARTVSSAPPAQSPAQQRVEEKKGLPFIEDDYGRAIAEARARDVPLFVDVWAPW